MSAEGATDSRDSFAPLGLRSQTTPLHGLRPWLHYAAAPRLNTEHFTGLAIWTILERTDQLDRDIDRELAFHIAELVDEYVSSGMSHDEAVRKAKRQLGNSVKKEIWAVENRLPFASIATMDQLVARSFGPRRFNLVLLGSFALIALVLAGVGIYGLVSFSTRQRNNEIRIRMTLGATQQTILRMILGEGVLLTVIGVIIGLAGAFAFTRFLQSLLFGVEATDLLTFATVTGLLVAVALLASYIPAYRIIKMDPMPGRQ